MSSHSAAALRPCCSSAQFLRTSILAYGGDGGQARQETAWTIKLDVIIHPADICGLAAHLKPTIPGSRCRVDSSLLRVIPK